MNAGTRSPKLTMRDGKDPAVKLKVYEDLLAINAGLDQAVRRLAALRRHRAFHQGELERLRDLIQETRALSNSYLASVVEHVETEKAGRWFGKRRRRERGEESGNGKT